MATINTATYKVRVRRGSRQHVYHVESATHPNTFYTTDAYNMTCSCPAGRKGKRCWHLATAIAYDGWRKAQQARAAASARPAGMAALQEAFVA
jgi:phage-related tail fiber protein